MTSQSSTDAATTSVSDFQAPTTERDDVTTTRIPGAIPVALGLATPELFDGRYRVLEKLARHG
jgi:hypothetical protein